MLGRKQIETNQQRQKAVDIGKDLCQRIHRAKNVRELANVFEMCAVLSEQDQLSLNEEVKQAAIACIMENLLHKSESRKSVLMKTGFEALPDTVVTLIITFDCCLDELCRLIRVCKRLRRLIMKCEVNYPIHVHYLVGDQISPGSQDINLPSVWGNVSRCFREILTSKWIYKTMSPRSSINTCSRNPLCFANELDLAKSKHTFRLAQFGKALTFRAEVLRVRLGWFTWNGNTDMEKFKFRFPHLKRIRLCVNDHEDIIPPGLDFDEFWDHVVALESPFDGWKHAEVILPKLRNVKEVKIETPYHGDNFNSRWKTQPIRLGEIGIESIRVTGKSGRQMVYDKELYMSCRKTLVSIGEFPFDLTDSAKFRRQLCEFVEWVMGVNLWVVDEIHLCVVNTWFLMGEEMLLSSFGLCRERYLTLLHDGSCFLPRVRKIVVWFEKVRMLDIFVEQFAKLCRDLGLFNVSLEVVSKEIDPLEGVECC